MTLSYHARNERADRLTAILVNIGLGEPVLTLWDERKQHKNVITSTGILLVQSPDGKTLVTAFVPTINKIHALCVHNSIPKVPRQIKIAVERNQTKFKWIAALQILYKINKIIIDIFIKI